MHLRPSRLLTLTSVLMVVTTAACHESGTSSSVIPSANGATISTEGTCRLLTTEEVSAALGGSKSGRADNSRREYGISTCEWESGQGRFAAQSWKAQGNSAKEEAEGLMLGNLDPLKSAAQSHVRYEEVTRIGEQAVAVVEAKDTKHGILSDAAMLVIRHNNEFLVLIAPNLAREDRQSALQMLETLGRKAVSRM
jgi:hypothetical protein